MINIRINILNPWSKRFKNIKCFYQQLTVHKGIEFEILQTSDIITMHIAVTHRQSHAGFEFEFGLFGYNLRVGFYDNRHWNYVLNKWETYEDTNSKTDH